jgi:hypothetical protein
MSKCYLKKTSVGRGSFRDALFSRFGQVCQVWSFSIKFVISEGMNASERL